MASDDAATDRPPAAGGRSAAAGLFGPWAWVTVWLPIALVTALHYASGPEATWIHGVLRRTYYLPIIVAASLHGVRGGLGAAAVTTLVYLPHAFLSDHGHHHDPAPALEKWLEILLYFVVGGGAGLLSDRARRRAAQLEVALVEQRRLSAALARSQRLSALGELVAGVAHEIKNPLHALRGTAEIVDPLVPEGSDERPMWLLHRAELDRLGRVAERFLSYARPRAPDLRPLDLREVAERVHALLRADARARDLGCELEVGPAAVMVVADRDQLIQVGLNIALNAARAAASGEGPGRRVLVACFAAERPTSSAVLRIENDGPALDEAHIEDLFDPFVRGREGEGDAERSGLGLSIAARLVEQQGGTIEASNAGLGVRFDVTLPRGPEDAPAGPSRGAQGRA